jgi:peptidoglycan hydrolase CwlO-like protein
MKMLKKLCNIETLSALIPRWIGSMESLVIHTVLFAGSYFLILLGYSADIIFALVTNIVSLEAIYLSIFLLMSANIQLKKLHVVADGVKEIQEDVDEIQKDVDEIQEDVDEIQEDVKEIQEEDEDDEVLSSIEKTMKELMKEIIILKNRKK